MKTEVPADDTIQPHEHPLYKALKQLASDLRILFELASKEDEKSWISRLTVAKKEIEAMQSPPDWMDQEKFHVYKNLIEEVYDRLAMLVAAVKSSQDKYRRLATRDLLTGVYNRNYFNETIVRDIERAKRFDERLSFILLDVNDFKRINDTYGHLHGDGVLRACAEILRKSVRKSDFLCRYGGDEFVIVTPRPTCGGNGPLFDRIQENVDEWNARFSAYSYRLSFSVGCAVWEQGKDVLQVLQEADREMYRNKKSKAIR